MRQVTKYGSHSNTHPHVNNLSKEKNIEELRLCNEKIEIHMENIIIQYCKLLKKKDIKQYNGIWIL